MKELKLYDQHSLKSFNIFESNWGLGTIYIGTFLTDWMKTSGIEEDKFCKNVPRMLSSIDVLESVELEKLNIGRECDLFNRSINI